MTMHLRIRALLAVAALAAPPVAFAAARAEAAAGTRLDAIRAVEQKVSADDGAADDNFGYAVDVSGDVAVVGASNAAVGGVGGQGAAYVFTRSNGVWSQAQKLVADDGAADDAFGFSVSISGDRILVGAPYATVGANGGQGAAYVFANDAGTWSQVQKLTADDGDANNNFGWSVAISGTNAVISSPVAAVGSNALQGKAYVFSDDGVMWNQGDTLLADDGSALASFGYSVAIDGDTIVVGAQGVNSYFGEAYVFANSGGSWTQTGTLMPDDGTTLEFFGISVSVSGSNAIVGAYYQNVGGHNHQGSAYVFSNDGGTWSQAQKLTATDGAAGDRFGLSVSIDGTTALVGAYYAGGQQGSAYVFTDNGGTWAQTDQLLASDGVAGDHFGNAVAVDGSTSLVAAFDATIGANASQGAAYFYESADTDTIFIDGFDGAP